MRILLADDSSDHQLLLRSHLRTTSHRLEVVDAGPLAVEMFKSRQFELILVASKLAGLDGAGVIRAIRAWEKQMGAAPIPVVAFTGREPNHVRDALDAGASAHLPKPVGERALFECLSGLRWPDPSVVWTGQGGEDRTKRITIKVDPALKSLIPGFLEKRAADLAELKASLKANDFENIRLVAHRLKGKGAGYGFAGISRIGDALEQGATSRDLFALREGIDELQSYLSRLDLVD